MSSTSDYSTPTIITAEQFAPTGGSWIKVTSGRSVRYFEREFGENRPTYGKTKTGSILDASGTYYKLSAEEFEKLSTSVFRKHYALLKRVDEAKMAKYWRM